MKNLVRLTIICALACTGMLVAQNASAAGWIDVQAENIAFPTTTLFDVDYIDNDTGIAVGADGEVTYTNDGGLNWTAGTSGTTEALFAVDYVDASTAYAVGGSGTVLQSTDGGETWSSQSSGTTNTLLDVSARDASIVIAVGEGGKIIQTSNGGTTWNSRNSGTSEDLYGADWNTSSATVWAVGGNGKIIKSTSAALFWTSVTSPTTETLYDIDTLSSGAGIIVGKNGTFLTSLTGTSWAQTADTDVDSSDIYEVVITGSTIFDSTAFGEELIYEVVLADVFKRSLNSNVVLLGGYSNGDFTIGAGGKSGTPRFAVYDDTSPTINAAELSGGSPDNDTTPMVLVSADDDWANGSSLTYYYYANGVTDHTSSSNESSLATALSDGTHTLGVRVYDSAGNFSDLSELTYVLDLHDPVIGTIDDIERSVGVSTTFSATVSDSTDLTCELLIDEVSQGESLITTSSQTSTFHTFTSAGTYEVKFQCTDEVGYTETGTDVTITVAEASTETETETETEPEAEAASEADPGNLIKMACSGVVDVNDPCKAVYFYASDGSRHAFPNEKVYFTWYDDFDDVIIVTDDFMASLSLGTNVTYHPGTKMVKFQSVHTVYAVEKEGVLRAIGSEDIAASLYGSNWNTKIDDINDAFFGNYSFGDDIDNTSDYDVDDAVDSVTDLDDNF